VYESSNLGGADAAVSTGAEDDFVLYDIEALAICIAVG